MEEVKVKIGRTSLVNREGVKEIKYGLGGPVAKVSRKSLNLNTITSLYPLCRGRLFSIKDTIDSIYFSIDLKSSDHKVVELASERKIVSSMTSGLETYIFKGLAIPAKQLTGNLIKVSTESFFIGFSSLMTSSFTSLFGCSVNIFLAYRDIRKNGAAPSYETFIYSFYLLQLISTLIVIVLTYAFAGLKEVAMAALITTTVFLIIFYIAKLINIMKDKRVQDELERNSIEKLYQDTSEAISRY